IETHLRHQPERTSRSRIKRLRGLLRPQYRLRVDEVRVFYDVTGSTVQILAIVPKSEAEAWLARGANSGLRKVGWLEREMICLGTSAKPRPRRSSSPVTASRPAC